jgi:hypothetical protein
MLSRRFRVVGELDIIILAATDVQVVTTEEPFGLGIFVHAQFDDLFTAGATNTRQRREWHKTQAIECAASEQLNHHNNNNSKATSVWTSRACRPSCCYPWVLSPRRDQRHHRRLRCRSLMSQPQV